MQFVAGIWICLAGGIAALTGLAGMRRIRRLKRTGATAWAMVLPHPSEDEDQPGRAGRRVLVQFSLDDGRIVEHSCVRSRRTSALRSGQNVLVWYDRADPSDVLVYDRHSRRADGAFVTAGLGLIIVGAMIAAGAF
jgi:hypothetical protein